MADDGPEPQSLKALFRAAESARASLERSREPSSPAYRDALATAITSYERCLGQMDALALFSPNETAEDVGTADLPYLLVHHRLAELVQRVPAPSPAQRRQVLARAQEAYERFLHRLDAYGLLDPAHARQLERYADDPAAFSTTLATATAAAAADPAARRAAKIANFRREKELRERLALLRRRPARLNGADDDDDDDDDDEAARAAHLAELDFCAHTAFQGLESLAREVDILAQAPDPLRHPSPGGRGGAGANADADGDGRARTRVAGWHAEGYTDRLDFPLRRLQSAFGNGGPLLDKQGKPLQPFTLVGGRQELQQGVFRPGHNLPTMSIDEYLEEERRRGGIIEGGGEASGRRPEPDEDDMDRADAETMKARAWDEFTEANPKGAGNTLNRG